MNGPGLGDAATFGPFVRDPADYRGGPDDDAYTTAGLLHEVNRLIAKANDAMAAKTRPDARRTCAFCPAKYSKRSITTTEQHNHCRQSLGRKESTMEQHENLPAVAHDGTGSAMSLVMDDGAMESMMTAAKLMASARVTIPKHLQNSTGDCLAVIMQAAQWKMNPFAVAQKTHLTQGGALGYEAQLVNAVIVSCGAIVGQPEFEFFGDWSKILGKVAEKTSEKSGGKYYVSTWDRSAESGLGVKCIARLKGNRAARD